MGTLRDYFETDCKGPSISHVLSAISPQQNNQVHTITFKIHILTEAHSKYLSIYSGNDVDLNALSFHLQNQYLRTCDITKLLNQSDEFHIEMNSVSLKDLVFTKKLIIYVEKKLTNEQIKLTGYPYSASNPYMLCL